MSRPVVVVDTGPLVALADGDDADHERCVKWLRTCTARLVIPSPIVAEACYLLGSRCGAEVEAAFLEALVDNEPFEVVAPGPGDYLRMAELVRVTPISPWADQTRPSWHWPSGWERWRSRPWIAGTSRSCGRGVRAGARLTSP
ncbi:type II toxin-antitoxin system VapC family toxin [Phytohabitans kaempferiae]|uniref:Type II toxin-antitoxin system VapC family toxin n=1 Tax=Phytohabitans kaempferiae TaxID=1620943 RepID=A0ABV6LX77_9ACTN